VNYSRSSLRPLTTLDALRHNEPAPARDVAHSAPVIAPARWVEKAVPAGELGFEEPCLERRGLIERRGGAFLHFCIECGRWGAFGYGCTGNNPGRWYCRKHRPEE
jgi:hypothetical protein